MSSVTAVAMTGADQLIYTGPCWYVGFSMRATATAVVRIYNGTSAAGTLLETIALAQDTSRSEHYAPEGIKANVGIYVDVVSGTVEGSIRLS